MADASKVGAGVAAGLGTAGSIFATAAAANAIPVAGQFVSAGLAIAGMFIKIFAGRKQKKQAEAKAKDEARRDQTKAAFTPQANGPGGVGVSSGQGPAQGTAPVAAPNTTSFSGWGGGTNPSVQPAQQAINNSIGLR